MKNVCNAATSVHPEQPLEGAKFKAKVVLAVATGVGPAGKDFLPGILIEFTRLEELRKTSGNAIEGSLERNYERPQRCY